MNDSLVFIQQSFVVTAWSVGRTRFDH